MSGHVLANMNEVISYDYNYNHKAVDIVGAGNSIDDVIAFDGGVVEIAINNIRYTDHNSSGTATYGNFVKIRHSDGTKTLYAHLKYGTVLVSAGQMVSKGQKIGTMGATGNAYGVHLHFEVRDSNDNTMNPKDYLYKKIENNVDENINKEVANDIQENTVEVSNDDLEIEDEIIVDEKNTEGNSEDNDEKSLKDNDSGDAEETFEEDISEDDFDIEELKKELYAMAKIKSNHKKNDVSSYASNTAYHGGSIVDGLKELGIDSSFENRSIIAYENGITDYQGTYSQNVHLLKLLKSGLLKA